MPHMSRRDFAKGAASLLAVPAIHSLAKIIPETSSDSHSLWPGYDRAVVIDMLATATPFNVPDSFARPLTLEMIDNARKSGITAVNVTVSGGGFVDTVSNIAYWERELAAHPDVFLKVRTVADLDQAKRTSRFGIILGFQDATMLESDLSRVDLFYNLGVRIIQLTYNVRNLVGDGCLEAANGGLSAFGRKVVERMNSLGMLVDVSHVGRQTSLDAVNVSSKPIAATHTGCAALNDVPRNKPDALLKAIADKGGVVGIYLMPFLKTGAQPSGDDLMRHVTHAVNVCGEDHVGIGSDLSTTPLDLTPEFRAKHAGFVRQRRSMGISAPGEDENVFNYVPDFNSPRRMELIADALAKAGHSSSRIEKIIGGNWARVLREVWVA